MTGLQCLKTDRDSLETPNRAYVTHRARSLDWQPRVAELSWADQRTHQRRDPDLPVGVVDRLKTEKNAPKNKTRRRWLPI